MENLWIRVQEWVTFYGLKVLAALVILIVGRWVSGWLKDVAARILARRKVDPTIVSFVGHLTYIALITFLVIAALAQLGIQTTSFIAVIGAAGLAIGLALQGSLANFAAGFLMIIFKPFKAGDYIEGAGAAALLRKSRCSRRHSIHWTTRWSLSRTPRSWGITSLITPRRRPGGSISILA